MSCMSMSFQKWRSHIAIEELRVTQKISSDILRYMEVCEKMRLMSTYLIESEIERIKSKKEIKSEEKIRLSVLEKEIEVLRFLDINGIDLRGTVEDFRERLKNSEIFIIQKNEFNVMKKKSEIYERIKSVILNEFL